MRLRQADQSTPRGDIDLDLSSDDADSAFLNEAEKILTGGCRKDGRGASSVFDDAGSLSRESSPPPHGLGLGSQWSSSFVSSSAAQPEDESHGLEARREKLNRALSRFDSDNSFDLEDSVSLSFEFDPAELDRLEVQRLRDLLDSKITQVIGDIHSSGSDDHRVAFVEELRRVWKQEVAASTLLRKHALTLFNRLEDQMRKQVQKTTNKQEKKKKKPTKN